MYYIYKIENKMNAKIYIGSTNDPNKRWKQHLWAAKDDKQQSYSFPLQKAIRKYGEDCFSFEVIDNSEDSKEISEKEREWIIKSNSLTNSGWGYNQTLYTDCALRDPEIIKKSIERTAVKCCLVSEDGSILEIFDSLHEAGRCLSMDASLIKSSCDGKVKSASGKILRYYEDGIVHNEISKKAHLNVCGISIYNVEDKIIFKNVSEAARETKAARGSISKCINGSSKYSRVQERIWRKIDLFGNIIENEIPITSLLKHKGE